MTDKALLIAALRQCASQLEESYDPCFGEVGTIENAVREYRLLADLCESKPDTEAKLRVAARSVVAWFDAVQAEQTRLLITGQSLESASANWDEATLLAPLDIEPLRAALALADGGM